MGRPECYLKIEIFVNAICMGRRWTGIFHCLAPVNACITSQKYKLTGNNWLMEYKNKSNQLQMNKVLTKLTFFPLPIHHSTNDKSIEDYYQDLGKEYKLNLTKVFVA